MSSELLTPGWLADLDAAARAASVPPDLRLVIQQVVTEAGTPELAYAIRIGDGSIAVHPGRADDADVTFTQDRATAHEIATGALSAQAAFLSGRLRVGGDLSAVLDRARTIAGLDELLAVSRPTG